MLCLTSRGLSTDDHELDLTNVNPLISNLDLCTKVIQMSIYVLKADAKFFLEQTQLLMINQLQDILTQRSLSTAYRILKQNVLQLIYH